MDMKGNERIEKAKRNIPLSEVRSFWERSPLCVSSVPYEPGSLEFFNYYDKLREINEPIDFSYRLHEYPNFRGKKVLDVGCGNGYVLSRYALEGAYTFGIDLTSNAIEISKRRFKYMGLKGVFIQGNAESMPFKGDTFDCLCSMGVLHHTPDTEGALREVYRVLKPSGRVILMFYHRNSILNRVGFPISRFLNPRNWLKHHQTMINDVDGYGNPKGDVYSKSEMRRLLGDKFRHLEMFTGLVRPGMMLPLGYLMPQRFLNALAQRWGWFLYIKGWK